jgi:FtsZ-binding cell division protein ZapB
MISEFQDLSDKIDRLAEMTLSLRRENAALRQSNAVLSDENAGYQALLAEARDRVAALLEKIPAPDAADATAIHTTDDEAAP